MRRNAVCWIVLATSIAVSVPRLVAEDSSRDWPQYRGPERDGSALDAGILASWPDDGPKVLWKRSIGTGFSGIAVSGERLFTMMAESEKEYAVAFDAASGEEVWRVEVGEQFPSEFGDGPRSTPAVSGNDVIVLGSYGQLVALAAADGKQRWSVDLREEFGSVVPQHGFSTAPMIDDDLLLVEVGGGRGQAFAALDPATGSTRWTTQDGAPTYTSPIAVTIGGQRQLISIGDNEIFGLSRDGELAWSYPWRGGIAMPIFVAPDKLFVSAFQGSLLTRVVEGDGGTGIELVWQSNEMKNHFNSSVIHDGHVYGFDNAILKCVSLEGGERVWAKRGLGKGSLIVADGHLIILGERGQLVQAQATPEGFVEEGRIQAIDGKSWTSPTLADGRLYLRNMNDMIALDLRG